MTACPLEAYRTSHSLVLGCKHCSSILDFYPDSATNGLNKTSAPWALISDLQISTLGGKEKEEKRGQGWKGGELESPSACLYNVKIWTFFRVWLITMAHGPIKSMAWFCQVHELSWLSTFLNPWGNSKE